MDILNLITAKDRVGFSKAYNYQTDFLGDKLFPNKPKTENLEVEFEQLLAGSTIPVMAKVKPLDTETPIGDRPNFETVKLSKMLIAEKINQTERIMLALRGNKDHTTITDFIFNDAHNMVSRVLTRKEVMRMELLSTGIVTARENEGNVIVDYRMNQQNKPVLSDWSNPDADILGDLRRVQEISKDLGIEINKALTSGTILGFIMANNGVRNAMAGLLGTNFFSESDVIKWLQSKFGIVFRSYDKGYKTSIDGATQRFYPANKITFFGGSGAIGSGLHGYTAEDLKEYSSFKKELKEAYVTVSMWDTPDPVATWTRASSIYIPVVNNINDMIIATIQ